MQPDEILYFNFRPKNLQVHEILDSMVKSKYFINIHILCALISMGKQFLLQYHYSNYSNPI